MLNAKETVLEKVSEAVNEFHKQTGCKIEMITLVYPEHDDFEDTVNIKLCPLVSELNHADAKEAL